MKQNLGFEKEFPISKATFKSWSISDKDVLDQQVNTVRVLIFVFYFLYEVTKIKSVIAS